MIRVVEIDPRIRVDLRYATSHNVTGRVLYASSEAWLRAGTMQKLRVAQDLLADCGVGLKLWDAYRPPSAQRALWAWRPDERFVAPPERGSRHTRGASVDVTLVDTDGADLEMPSAFDEFSERAHRNWSGGSAVAQRHRDCLMGVMEDAGFAGIQSEWWHFDDTEWRDYPLLEWEP